MTTMQLQVNKITQNLYRTQNRATEQRKPNKAGTTDPTSKSLQTLIEYKVSQMVPGTCLRNSSLELHSSDRRYIGTDHRDDCNQHTRLGNILDATYTTHVKERKEEN